MVKFDLVSWLRSWRDIYSKIYIKIYSISVINSQEALGFTLDH